MDEEMIAIIVGITMIVVLIVFVASNEATQSVEGVSRP